MGSRARSLGLALGLLGALAVLSFGIGSRGLLEPSEGRYGSIAAEMSRSGDFVVPRLNGVEHFEKPPLSMWAMAAAVRVIGENEAALRIPGVLAALGAVAIAYLLAGGRGRARAWLAALLALASPLLFAMARVVTTDVYLAFFCALSLLFAARALEADDAARRSRFLTLAMLASALGFLVKGPVVWVFTLLPLAVEAVVGRRHRELLRIFHPARILLFVLVVAPWFVAAGLRVPGLLEWFLAERALGAFASSEGFHDGPFYYYLPVFVLGLLPAGLILLGAGPRGWAALAGRRHGRLLLLATAIPLLFFSFSASKLATYLLPAAVPVAVLAGNVLATGRGRSGVLAGASTLVVLVAGTCVAAWQLGWFSGVELAAARLLALAGGLTALGAAAAIPLALYRETTLAAGVLATFQLLALLACVPVATIAGDRIGRLGTGRELAREIGAQAEPGLPIVCYRTLVRSLPFYTGREVFVVGWYGDDGLDDGREAVALDRGELDELLARTRVLLVCCAGDAGRLLDKVPAASVIWRGEKLVLLTHRPETEVGLLEERR